MQRGRHVARNKSCRSFQSNHHEVSYGSPELTVSMRVRFPS